MKKIVFLLASVLLIQSCTSTSFRGGSSGMWAGATMGGAIGGLVGGHRGHHLGTVIGVIAGAAAGSIAANAAASAERRRYEEYVSNYDRSSRRSNRNARKVEDYSNSDYRESVENENRVVNQASCPLVLRNLRFIDDGGNQVINRNEDCKIIFELANSTGADIFDVVPYVYEVNGNSHVTLSPSTRIEVVKNGDVVRYTCSLRADNKLSNGTLKFRISVSCGDNDFVTLREFSLPSSK